MRKGICLVGILAILLSFSSPVFATEVPMVPSVANKETPPIKGGIIIFPEDMPPELEAAIRELLEQSTFEGDLSEIGPCLVVTSILQAVEKATDIFQSTRDELLWVYEALANGSMSLFDDDSMGLAYDGKNYVVIHLVDVSFREGTCHSPAHLHYELLELEGVDIAVDFDLAVAANANVKAFHYRDGRWIPVKSLTNNGDGTVTCVFEHFCPVAFCIEVADEKPTTPPKTGDEAGGEMTLWISAMVLSMAALVVLLVLYRKADRK